MGQLWTPSLPTEGLQTPALGQRWPRALPGDALAHVGHTLGKVGVLSIPHSAHCAAGHHWHPTSSEHLIFPYTPGYSSGIPGTLQALPGSPVAAVPTATPGVPAPPCASLRQ